jgi:hypothetical protein
MNVNTANDQLVTPLPRRQPRKACRDPYLHMRLERDAAQEHRPPPPVDCYTCPWCGGVL